jgi:methionyl aminopeptidase
VSIETPEELCRMRAAGRAVALTLATMRGRVRPGVTTAELDEAARRVFAAVGARSAPRLVYGFPGETCISVNDEAVHGIPGSRTVEPGDLVTLDVTLEVDGYMADAAVTVPVPPVDDEALALCACAEAALARGIRAARAGRSISEIGAAVQQETERRGFRVLSELTGHGIGRTIHEPPLVPNVATLSDDRLEEGTVITIEPIVAAGGDRVRQLPDGWTLSTADGARSAHAEHTLVVRRGRPLVLTAA